jgi:YHS domain-containing protein
MCDQKSRAVAFIAVLFILFFTNTISAQTSKYANINKSGTAISGYDAVAYFTPGKPAVGDKKYSCSYNGATYQFATSENLKKFNSNPATYEPAYGGWCAYAMGASGEKVKVDPETFKIINGKLYLFYNFYFTNTLDSWNKKEAKLKLSADNNWKTILNKNP